MKDSNALRIKCHRRMPLFILLMFSLLLTSCLVTNRFIPPKNLPTDDNKKRLIIFRASVVDIKDRLKQSSPTYPILGIPNGNKRLINIEQPLSGNCTYVIEIDITDTGSITFLMGRDRPSFNYNLYTDTTIHYKDLAMGNNYWHLNYYVQSVRKIGWVPVLTLTKIDISDDSFIDYKNKFRFALRYNLSADSIIFEKNKFIVTRQKSSKGIYKSIMTYGTSVDSIKALKRN